MPLLILDRDGVINEDSQDYIRNIVDWHPVPGSIEAIAELSKAGYRVAIATNQSGLSRGYFGLDEMEEIHQKLCALVEEQGGGIAGIFYCPHLPDEGCECRKPATGLLQAIEAELDEPAANAWFIGDSLKDLQAATAHGCRPALVLTGKGETTRAALADHPELQAVPIFNDLAEVGRFILGT
jgi:D-glycero-D-manno-heptose 1,7-bisphosphate phosphatase